MPGTDLEFWGRVLATGEEGMIYVDADHRIIAANTPAAAIMGLAGQDLKGRRLTEVFPETRLAEVFTGGRPLMNTLFATGGKNYRVDYFPDGQGGVALLFKAREPDAAQLQTINGLYASLLDDFPLYLVVVNRQGIIVSINQIYAGLLGQRAETLIGREVRSVLPFSRLPEVLATGKPVVGHEVQYAGKKLLLSEMPVKDAGGNLLGAAGKALALEDLAASGLTDISRRLQVLENKIIFYRQELRSLQGEQDAWQGILGNSPAIVRLKHLAARVAGGEANVLITGESGTGKELLAQALHRSSPRGNEPLIKINCAAIPENLLEAELFGYEEGAFTGAARGGKPGKFELADGGTIFLDEIGDLPLSMQPKLLRALQERSFERVGGRKTIKVDVRIIAATNQDLLALEAAGKFRRDLYYRLAVVTLHIPSLRERPEDIEVMTAAIIRRLNSRYGLAVKGLAPEVQELFYCYTWPGNVRELENVLEHAFNFLEPGEEIIRREHLPATLSQVPGREPGLELKEAVAAAEREAIQRALAAAGGNKQEAARILGIHPSGLYQKLKRYSIEIE
ncbi:sigma 54-interacting transcriptional regulator [Moorella sp. Hama-1]|uniref:sigma 54-interacting transcriptional regulator n=1 Tax=Moorella sp. Hama-1 TaxID=2138101 RepID=UPI00137A4D43|nr:sigma 54-interacting transcriptional regulator [Moorella sp. Hama-1]BCV22250.1 sigma-54-dependent Fis family transcriptional regulator [Moorella sp. Hama-1]